MDWSRIKTIFILTFLVLDIYLMYEFFKLKDSSQYEYSVETSFEKRLKADEIEYVELPKNYVKDTYLSAKPKNFNIDAIESLEKTKLKGLGLQVNTGTVLKFVLDKPFELSDEFDTAEINSFIKSNVLFGDQYRFWKKEGNAITYYQQFDDKVFYHNMSGELTIYLNEENDIVTYNQTMLEDIEELSEEQKIIQPLKAIETLYENGSLRPKSKITKVELGYFTFVQTSTSQVLTPAWRFVINDKEDVFVHAFEGQIIQLNNEDKNIVE
ncbi:two-component system regulatory protein YycI [Bacillus sp. DTU_2020_1000418_1_SI_GHA_SEK_038]|uniref:two-component system regulatory protein YycI n=1 Tax=Bacillus sp. DTU_2020_1000418_1_SI_GHA_SEK_038 TaxID=3077585 RepID=UPI0028EF0373|nr:two-component system regulatory protein YycI [Bacillus sp. DTU_2020_1000418_1_SI_GHA_SEK_038]WNS75481.1 two-component system regulatory protein YycI [Bacillus sp. DTU_2020_1000418_1_SI_GHA_SEK_038]